MHHFSWVYRHNNPQLIDQSERTHWFGYYIKNDINAHVEVIHWTFTDFNFGLSDDNMDKGKELQVVEQTLMPHLEEVL